MNTKINERRARALTFMLSLGMLAGVLIWAKLRLVTDIPRSAYPVPRELMVPEHEMDDVAENVVDQEQSLGDPSSNAVHDDELDADDQMDSQFDLNPQSRMGPNPQSEDQIQSQPS